MQTFSGSILSLNTAGKVPFYRRGFFAAAIGILKEMTNFSLLRENIPFLFVTLSNLFIFLGYFIPFLYIPLRAKELELAHHSYLLSIIGIVNIPVRMLFGLVADLKIVAPINLNTMSVVVATAPFFFYFALTTFWTQSIFSVMFAIGIAGINSLTTMYLVQLVGLKKFNNATGIVNLFRGLGCFLGTPIGGFISTKTGNILNSFLYSGICFSVGLFFTLLISIMLGKCCAKKGAAASGAGDEKTEEALKNGSQPEAEKLVDNPETNHIVKV